MNLYYKLDENHNPVPCNLWDFAEFMGDPGKKFVKQDHLSFDGIFISTVFLGLDHSFGGGTPVLFETVIFGGIHDQFQERYCTWDEALAGHQRAIEMVFELTHN